MVRRVRKTKPSARKSYDVLFWLLADKLAFDEGDIGVANAAPPCTGPTTQQQQLLLASLCQLMAFSDGHQLSQLILQLLLLSHCMPCMEAMRAGAPEALHFVSSLVHACKEASLAAPGEMIFAEVQISFVLASAVLSSMCCDSFDGGCVLVRCRIQRPEAQHWQRS